MSPAFPEKEAATYWVPSQQLMVKALKRNFPGMNIIVIATLYPHKISYYQWNGIDVVSFNGNHRRKILRLGLWRDVWKRLKNICNTQNVAGILSFWCGESAFLGNRIAKKYSIAHCIWICGQDARKLNHWVKLIRPKENQLMAMSPFLAKEFYKSHGIQPKHIVSNAIDPVTFPVAPSSNERDIDILGVGSFEPLKRYDLLTTVIKSISNSLPSVKAFHCGIGKEKSKIESLIEKQELQNTLYLLGGKPQEEILALMQRTRVFLHTSNYEGFSTVCLEALYAGAHVVSFCYPLDHAVPHWHIVNTAEEMIARTIEILKDDQRDHKPVMLYSMDESAKAVMNLFSQNQVNRNISVAQKHFTSENTENSP